MTAAANETAADLAVVGAGAAGLAAAIFAGETAHAAGRPLRIVAVDSAAALGKKILISGGGRCNVTNAVIRPEDFNGPRPVIRNVLAEFDGAAVVRWFRSLGVELKCEDAGKLFPVTDRARTVVDALLRRVQALGIATRLAHRVNAVSVDDGFVLHHQHGVLRARLLVLATGGQSLPRTGSDGSGWEIARGFGHSVTSTYPALVPLLLRPDMFHRELAGVSQTVALSVFAAGKRTHGCTGSLLWTHFGVSGPAVMDISRHWVVARAGLDSVVMRCCFFPGQSIDDVDRWLLAAARARPAASLQRLVGSELPERAAAALLRRAGLEPMTRAATLPRAQRQQLARVLAALELPVEGVRGWDFAEVTAGGVPLAEVDHRTMRSRKAAGLYLVGEMLDCDGRIGGYNFHWAWATGYLAGRAAARAGVHA